MGEGIVKEFRMDTYTLLYLKWIPNKDLTVQYMELCSLLCGQLDGRGVSGRGDRRGEWIHVYIWLSPLAVHLKLLQHCLLTGYTPIQN